jgi:NTP pyrophosphatase (non-canonical NTP hydrolase)
LTYQIDPDDDGDESVDVVKKAIQDHVANYGEHAIDVAYDKMVEEVGELLVAMRHHQRGRAGEEAVIEELADVALLTLLIASLHEAGPEIKRITEMKAKRFSNRLVKNKVAGGMVC